MRSSTFWGALFTSLCSAILLKPTNLLLKSWRGQICLWISPRLPDGPLLPSDTGNLSTQCRSVQTWNAEGNFWCTHTIYVPCMYESWILDEMPVIAQGPTDGGWSPCLKVFDLRNTLWPLAVAHFLHLGTFTLITERQGRIQRPHLSPENPPQDAVSSPLWICIKTE